MTSYAEIKEQWDRDSIARSELDQFLKSRAWQLVSAMINAEAVEEAESYMAIAGDTLLARNLSRQRGARWALTKIQEATMPPPAPTKELIEFEHIVPKEDQHDILT